MRRARPGAEPRPRRGCRGACSDTGEGVVRCGGRPVPRVVWRGAGRARTLRAMTTGSFYGPGGPTAGWFVGPGGPVEQAEHATWVAATCGYCWGGHGCDLPKGHDGTVHRCGTVEDPTLEDDEAIHSEYDEATGLARAFFDNGQWGDWTDAYGEGFTV